jgi:plasmid stabilization system protein ParE
LAKFPRIGRVVPEQNDENICEIIFKPYRIFYRVKDEIKVVEVIRFWHAARDKPEI